MCQIDLNRRRTVDLRQLVQFHRDQLGVLVHDQNGIGCGERHHCRNHRPQAVHQAVLVHDVNVRDDQERRRQHVGQQREVGDDPALAQAHPAQRKTRQRADHHGQQHRRDAQIDAVGELMPEMIHQPVIFRPDRTEAGEIGIRRPEAAGEFIGVGIERHQDHVVDRQQRPDQQPDAKGDAGRLGPQPPPASARPKCRPAARRAQHGAHNCTPVARVRRINQITTGIRMGSADIIAATPRSG